ncbi:hypothetical protein TIFTF001_037896 [Ficus carica]|uniref:non-specific serine/threonine protein kinase n=1 Tax=Ficus carica TaxID=3494 RepID=A0AA88E706_FICCA|nr:hypothetical protein TIFTF001_037896 [Ficus carica]
MSVSEINSALFTHLICAFADLNTSSYELSFPEEQKFSTFVSKVKQKNPLVTTLLSVGGRRANDSSLSSMVSNSSHRRSFIDSTIKFARLYGFQGLDLYWITANTSSDMENMGILFKEWRDAVKSESATNSNQEELILTAALQYSPDVGDASLPVDSIQSYLDWINIVSFGYYKPPTSNFTRADAALYDPSSNVSTDFGIKAWIGKGLSASKIVIGLPYRGYAWILVNPGESGIGAPAAGPAFNTKYGVRTYMKIREDIKQNNASVTYNSTYVVNYLSFGSIWIGFDDVQAIKAKISYAKENKLRGHFALYLADDDNWLLSHLVAQEDERRKKSKWRILVVIFTVTAAAIFVVAKEAKVVENYGATEAAAARDFNSNVPNLQVFSLANIEAATNGFSVVNKLGEGGYGPVYKGVLPNGQEIAVKKLSAASTQGYEEFENEVMLTAKLQHVNLVKVLGFCIEQDEHMLIYEYMPNKSLDLYLFDPLRRYNLDWKKRVDIIDGVTQGLLYLQEYSRLTVIHRDLKASNILLDNDMKPKISDFGLARIFTNNVLEANTNRVVGTIGFIPPEYAKQGLYSTKSDVYSFGVLLLQIISGKRSSCFYGLNEDLNLLDYAYEMWKEGRGIEFVDSSLDDSLSLCKLMKCIHIALLCVQDNANDRPSILEVSSMLRNDNIAMKIPKRPAFSIKKEDHQRIEVKSLQDTSSSTNYASISEVAPHCPRQHEHVWMLTKFFSVIGRFSVWTMAGLLLLLARSLPLLEINLLIGVPSPVGSLKINVDAVVGIRSEWTGV